MSQMIVNSAVFLGSRRQFKNVDVEITEDSVVVRNRADGSEFTRFPIIETAKQGEAWDIGSPDARTRLVVQQGCGCSGMRGYSVDPEYSGAL